jgi:hypothetical protein
MADKRPTLIGAKPRRLKEMVARFEGLADREMLHYWIAGAFLRKDRILAPLIVERGETVIENLEHIFGALSPVHQAKFRAAISRTIDARAVERFWPPDSIPTALALRDIVRLARVTAHYGLLSWAGAELIRLMSERKTPSDLSVIGEIFALIDGAEKWIPETEKRGPNYRSILQTFYDLSQVLEGRKSLSFLDAALLMPAVCYYPDKWPVLVCAAIERYDVGSEKMLPNGCPAFGGKEHPEGIGLYDLRTCLVRIVRERLTILQYELGVNALVNQSPANRASVVLLEILREEGLLSEIVEYIPAAPEELYRHPPAMQLVQIFFLGPAYIYGVNQGLFQFVTGRNLDDWLKANWAVATFPLNQVVGTLPAFHPIAILAGLMSDVRQEKWEQAARDPSNRSFKTFKDRRAASAIISSAIH